MASEREKPVGLNALAGNDVLWDSADSGSVSKAVEALLGLGAGPALLARGRITESEQKDSLKLLMRGYRMLERRKKTRRQRNESAPEFEKMPNCMRLVFLNQGLSISRDGEGRREVVSALIGQFVRTAVSRAKRLSGFGRRGGGEE